MALTKKIANISRLIKKQDYNTKITELEGKVPSIIGLVTTAALAVVESKIPKVSNLVQKVDYDAKIADIENKYITAAD